MPRYGPRPAGPLVLGASCLILVLAVSLVPVAAAVIRAPGSLPNGANEDQGFYLWAVARAMAAPSFRDFINNCDWPSAGCFDLRMVTQEWGSFYVIAKLGHAAGLGAPTALAAWYLVSLVLDAIAAMAFIGRISRNWILAGAVAPLVGLQQSLLYRLARHLALVSMWPLFVAAWALWEVLRGIQAGASRTRLLLWVAALSASLALTAFTSLYYLMFAGLLLPVEAIVVVAVVYGREQRGALLRRPDVKPLLAGLAAGGLAVGAVLVSHRPGSGALRQPPLVRSTLDVFKCSSRLVDYVKPSAQAGAPWPFPQLGLAFTNEDLAGRWSGVEYAFLGAVLIGLLLISALRLAYLAASRRASSGSWLGDDDVRVGVALTLVAIYAVGLSTLYGGLAVHRFVPAARCVSRIAPIVALMLAALVALAWRRARGASVALAIGVVFLGSVEMRASPFLAPEFVQSTAKEAAAAEALRPLCANGPAVLVPPVGDLLTGPYRAYYIAQIAGCRLGNVTVAGVPLQALSSSPGAIVRWGEGVYQRLDLEIDAPLEKDERRTTPRRVFPR